MHRDVRRVRAPLGRRTQAHLMRGGAVRECMIAPDRATVGVERVTALSAVGSGVPVAGMDQGLPIVVGGFFTRTGPNFLQPHWVW